MKIKCQHCGTEYEIIGDVAEHCVICETCGNEIAINETKVSGREEPEISNLLGIDKDTKQALLRDDYWTLSGRATRQEYWAYVSITLGIMFPICISIACSVISSRRNYSEFLGRDFFVHVFFLNLLIFILTFPVTVRRLHDRNMSGWFLLAFFVGSLIPVVYWFTQVAQFIIVECLDGTVGPNDFGPDPKGRQPIQPQVIVPPQSSAIKESPEERLLKLIKLKEAGFISEGEYEEKRQKILAEI